MFDISKIKITPEILLLISEIDEFKGAWLLHGRMAPERLKTLGLAAKIESIGASTRLDGAKLLDTDIIQLMFNSQTHTSKDERDASAYAVALDGIIQSHHSCQ